MLLLSSLILVMPVSSLAAPSPLTRVSSAAILSEEENIQLISYKAYLKVNSDTTLTHATFIIQNTNDEEQYSIMAGIPSHIYQGEVKIENLQVTMDGVKQRLTSRKDRTKQDEFDNIELPPNWSTWTIKLQPGEYKVIDITYTTDNQKDVNGTNFIYIPLEYLSYWYNMPQNIEITVDLEDTAPYLFEPNPSVLPHEYDNKGRLTWIYSNTYPSEYIQLFYRPIEQLAVEYISQQAQGDRSVSSILDSFVNKSYSLTINLIDQYLESEEESILTNEMLYLKALSLQNLFQTAETVALFDQLENLPLFGELEGTFKNKIIYDKYTHMKSLLADENKLYDYLNASKNYVMDNAMFLMWMEEELSELSAFITIPEEEPEHVEEEIPSPGEQQEEDTDNNLVKSVTIGHYEISVEFIFLGILAVVIILTTIINRRRKKKYRNRGYYFR